MKIADPKQDFPQWYQDVVQDAELAENGPVRGTMIIKPYGYALWEFMQRDLDERIKKSGAKNAYFPMFIPKSFIEREKEHVEGFSPELAIVTHAGGNDLAEPLVVRPTSETIINDAFSRWIKSYRDLPMLINQWANIVRWELRPRLFLRTTEFLWQEGHTAHATEAEADAKSREMLDVYADFAEKLLAIPVVTGEKSAGERFAGASRTYTIEGMMQDGKALQMGTSHNLGQNFAKVFQTQYLDNANVLQYVWQTSWGVSTRLVGGLIMAHGDAKGLVLPPLVAPIQVVIIPIKADDSVNKAVAEIESALVKKHVRVYVDARDTVSPGFKFNEWELKGVPVRIELGPRDLAEKSCFVVRRDDGTKTPTALATVANGVPVLLKTIQSDLLKRRKAELKERTRAVKKYDELVQAVATGFATGSWCGAVADEEQLKTEAKATVRAIPFKQPKSHDACVICGKPGTCEAVFARSY